jgi:hypothetical protein
MAAIGAMFSSGSRRRRVQAAAPSHDTSRAPGRRALAAALAAALLVVATGGIVGAQESGKPAETQKPPPRPTAAEVLAKAIAKQGMPKVADPAADLPIALRAKVGLQYKDDHGNDLALDAERRFLAPNLIYTKTVDHFSRKEVFTGFDGTTPWFWSEETGLRNLNGPDGVNDLKQLQLDVEMTDTLARAFLLRRLQRELKEAKLLDDMTDYGMTAWVVEGRSEIEVAKQKKRTVLRLYIEQKEARLMGARVLVEGDPPLQLCFTRHETVGGLDLPGKIEIYRLKDMEAPHGELRLTLFVNELDLAPKLTPADFKPPKS